MMAAAPSCIVCGGERWDPKHGVLLECAGCGFVKADLEIDESGLRELYGEGYFEGEEYGDYLADRDAHRKNFARRFAAMRRLAGHLSSVFEIGCAHGLWLEYLSSHGVTNAGIDVSESAVAYARGQLGQRAWAGEFLDLDIQPGSYQAFVMWDTIEHLVHPEKYIERIASLLPDRGWLFFTTGDIGSRVARRRGARWRMIHPPTHLQYFSRKTARQFLAGRGFEVLAAESMPVFRGLEGTLANLRALGRRPLSRLANAVARIVPRWVQRRAGLWVDLGDIIFVAARKTGA